MPQTIHTQVLIIGAGPAGYTAAIYAARGGLDPVLVSGLQPGGQLMITTDVENYPGFESAIQGPWLMEQMAKQAEHVGTRIVNDLLMSVDFSRRPFRCVGDSGDVYLAETAVIATGAQARWLGLPSERRLQGAGVSACATCDGFFYRGKQVAVIGGGNTAVEEALYLDPPRRQGDAGAPARQPACREDFAKAPVQPSQESPYLWDSAVEEVTGGGQPEVVTGLTLRNVRTGALSQLPVDGVFIAIGHTPNTTIFRGQVELDERRLRGHQARPDPDLRARRVRGRRRAGQALAPGDHRGRDRVHRGVGGREVPDVAGAAGGAGGGVVEKWLSLMPTYAASRVCN